MDKNFDEGDEKIFLDDVLGIQDGKTKNEIIKKLQEIKNILEKIAILKNMVDEKSMKILLINQNITKLQIKVDALKKEVTEDAKEIEKPEIKI